MHTYIYQPFKHLIWHTHVYKKKQAMSRFHLVSIELVESRQQTASTGNLKKLRGPWGFMYISFYGKCIQWIFQVPVKGGR